MDPVSLTTAVLALLGACVKASRLFSKIRNLQEAPELIQASNNEISDLHVMLLDLSDQIQSQGRKRPTLAHVDEALFQVCSSTLNQTRSKILEVEFLMQYRLLKPENDKGLVVNKLAFFQDRGKLVRLQMELRDARQKLANISCTMGMRDISRVEVILNDIQTQALPTILERQHKMEDTLDRILDLQVKTNSDIGDLSKKRMPQALSDSRHFGMEISVSRAAVPNSRIKCTCSSRQRFVYSETMLGFLFLGYMAAPIVATGRCLCLDHCKREFRVVYTFPSWFWPLQISMRIKGYESRNILFSLSLTQTISESHIAWSLVSQGNLKHLRELLVLKKLSLKAQHQGGTTLLAEAISTNISSARFLVEMGADIYYETQNKASAQMAAWEKILTKRYSSEWTDAMRSLFPEPDFDDLYGFGPLHKAVLSIGNRSLQDILRSGKLDIDEPDRQGRTALAWAASRNDTKGVQILLSYGANMETACWAGRIPIHEAVQSGLACTRLLIGAGADVTAKSPRGANALHYISYSDSDFTMSEEEIVEIAQLLLDAGAKINAKCSFGRTSLIAACYANRPKLVKLFIERGADLTSHDKTGENALSFAIRGNCHTILQQLLSEHLDHTGLLTVAAEAADTQTLKILVAQSDHFKRRNMNAVDRAKLTAWQVASQRTDVDAEWHDAFFGFMRAVDEKNVNPTLYDIDDPAAQLDQDLGDSFEVEDDEADQDFVEALEFQP